MPDTISAMTPETKERADRLRQAREEAGYDSAASFADAANLTESTYRHHENGTRNYREHHARTYERFLNRTWHWLMYGFDAGEADPRKSQDYSIDDDSPRSSRRMIKLEELDVRASAGSGQIVDVAPKKGEWQLPSELIKVVTDSPTDRVKIITIVGDSMQPTYNPVDRVMVDTADTLPTPPGVFVIWDGLGFVLKRIQYVPHSDPPRVRITSDNEKYDPYERVLGEAYIQGRVIGKWLWT